LGSNPGAPADPRSKDFDRVKEGAAAIIKTVPGSSVTGPPITSKADVVSSVIVQIGTATVEGFDKQEKEAKEREKQEKEKKEKEAQKTKVEEKEKKLSFRSGGLQEKGSNGMTLLPWKPGGESWIELLPWRPGGDARMVLCGSSAENRMMPTTTKPKP